MNYILTQIQLGNSVENCVIGNFIVNTPCLITTNRNMISLYTLPSLSLIRQKFVFEQVLFVDKFKMDEHQDGILIHFRKAKISQAYFFQNDFVISSLKYFENEDISVPGFMRCNSKMGILQLSRPKFAVFSLDNAFEAKTYAYTEVRSDIKNVVDISFLSKYTMPTICILYQAEIKRYTSDVPLRALVVTINVQTSDFHVIDEFIVDKQYFKICVIKNELAFIGHNELLFRNSSSTYTFPLNKFCVNRGVNESYALNAGYKENADLNVILGRVQCFSIENHLWIVNEDGVWLKCVMHLDIKRIVKVDVEIMPMKILASSVCLKDDWVFFGSIDDDSILFKLHKHAIEDTRNAKSKYLECMNSEIFASKEDTVLNGHRSEVPNNQALCSEKSRLGNFVYDIEAEDGNAQDKETNVQMSVEHDGVKVQDELSNNLASPKKSQRTKKAAYDIASERFEIKISPERRGNWQKSDVNSRPIQKGEAKHSLHNSQEEVHSMLHGLPGLAKTKVADNKTTSLPRPVSFILPNLSSNKEITGSAMLHNKGSEDVTENKLSIPSAQMDREYDRLFSKNFIRSYFVDITPINRMNNVGSPASLCYDDGLIFVSKKASPSVYKVMTELKLEQLWSTKIRGFKDVFALLVPKLKNAFKKDVEGHVSIMWNESAKREQINNATEHNSEVRGEVSVEKNGNIEHGLQSQKSENLPSSVLNSPINKPNKTVNACNMQENANLSNFPVDGLYILLCKEKESRLFKYGNGLEETNGDYRKSECTLLFEVLEDCVIQVTSKAILKLDFDFKAVRELDVLNIQNCCLYKNVLCILTSTRDLSIYDKSLRVSHSVKGINVMHIYDSNIVYTTDEHICIMNLDNQVINFRGKYLNKPICIENELLYNNELVGAENSKDLGEACVNYSAAKVHNIEHKTASSNEDLKNAAKKTRLPSYGSERNKHSKSNNVVARHNSANHTAASNVRILEIIQHRNHFFLRTNDNRLCIYKLYNECMYKCVLQYPVTFSLNLKSFFLLQNFVYVSAKTSYFVFCNISGVFMHKSAYNFKSLTCIKAGVFLDNQYFGQNEISNNFKSNSTDKMVSSMHEGNIQIDLKNGNTSLNLGKSSKKPKHKKPRYDIAAENGNNSGMFLAFSPQDVIFGVTKKEFGCFLLPNYRYYDNFISKSYSIHRKPRLIRKARNYFVIITSEDASFEDSEFSAKTQQFYVDLCVFWKDVPLTEKVKRCTKDNVNPLGLVEQGKRNAVQHIEGVKQAEQLNTSTLSDNFTRTDKLDGLKKSMNGKGVGSEKKLLCISSYRLKPNEMVTDIKHLYLNNEAEIKPYIVVCAGIVEGEDKLTSGALYLFEAIPIVPDELYPYKNMKLRIFARETTKGPITRCQALKNNIAISIGTKIMVYGITSSRGLIPIAFHELDMFTTSLVCIKNYICATDIYNGPKFFYYQSKPIKLYLLASSNQQKYTTTAEYLVHENSLSMVSTTKAGEINIHTYSPNNILSSGGTKLIKRFQFTSNLGRFVSESKNCLPILASETNYIVQLRQIAEPVYQTAILYQCTIMNMLKNTLGIHLSNYGEPECMLKALSIKAGVLGVVFKEFEFMSVQEQDNICRKIGISRSRVFMLMSNLFDLNE